MIKSFFSNLFRRKSLLATLGHDVPMKLGPVPIRLNTSCFSSFTQIPQKTHLPTGSILKTHNSSLLDTKPALTENVRTLVKFSWKDGKRTTEEVVTQKFFRLRWGVWIRTRPGRDKRLWKKTGKRRNRLSQHVFCNQWQSNILDTLVSKYWRKPKYYIEDPYEPYHSREEFSVTRRKPWRPEGCDYE